jgi:hypothetical protein
LTFSVALGDGDHEIIRPPEAKQFGSSAPATVILALRLDQVF